MQVYRPLYENSYAYRNGGLFDLRPLYMFYKPAIREGREVPRFTKITDPVVIVELHQDPHVWRPISARSGRAGMHRHSDHQPSCPLIRRQGVTPRWSKL